MKLADKDLVKATSGMAKSLYVNILLIFSVAIFSVTVATFLLYEAAIEETGNKLEVAASSQAKFLSIMLDREQGYWFSKQQLQNLKSYEGFGNTGEFVIAERVDDEIHFISDFRHERSEASRRLPMDSNLAAPMRMAFTLGSGIMLGGADYRGETVIAAYHKVPNHNFAVVAKIDLEEVRYPYLQAATVGAILSLVAAAIAGFIIYRLNRSNLSHLSDSNDKLERLNERLEHATESGQIGLFEYIFEGDLIYLNDVARSILNLPEDRSTYTTIESLKRVMSDDALKQFKASASSVANSSKRDANAYDLKFNLTETDAERYLRVNQAPLLQRGEVIGVSGSLIDITDQLDEAAKMREMNAKQQRIFAIIGHELRTPAASLRMLLDMQDMRGVQPHGKTISEVTDHLLDVLDDMRLVTHPELASEADEVIGSVPEIIEKSVSLIGRLLQEERLKVEYILHGDTHTDVFLKEQLFRQIVLNLVKNCALHAEATKLLITINAEQQDEIIEYKISFSDDGRGVDSDLVPRLFQAFERGDNSDRDGAGLGLHIAQQYLKDEFGGDIIYRTADTGGAEFVVSARLRIASTTPVVPSKQTQSESSILTGLKILFAEDSPVLRMTTNQVLSNKGAEVISAEDGAEAISLFDNDQFDLVLSDLFMPNADGYELATHIRKTNQTIPIIGLTAAVVGDEAKQFLACGADEVLSKPLLLTDLIDAISKAKK